MGSEINITIPKFLARWVFGRATVDNMEYRSRLTGKSFTTRTGTLFGLFDYEVLVEGAWKESGEKKPEERGREGRD